MAHPQTPVSGNESVPLECTSTQRTDRNSFVLVNTRDVSTQAAVEEFISREKTRDASTQTPEDGLRLFEQPPVTSETSEERRKRKISNEQEVTHDSHVCKLPRTESSERSDPLVSSLNVLSLYSGNTEFINTQQNVASNKNISQKEKAPLEKSDTDVSKVKNVCSVDDMLAASDTSPCLENKSNSKSSVEKLQNASPLKQQPPIEIEPKEPTCLVCKRTISKHVIIHDGKDLFICCRCSTPYEAFNYQLMPVPDEPMESFYCNVCQIKYSKKRSHGRSGRCNFCNQNFECNYQLNEHFILLHLDLLRTNCRICTKKLDEHSTLSKEVHKRYQCCFGECKKWTNSTICLNLHLNKHFNLKLFKCRACGYHFKQYSDLSEHLYYSHPWCNKCEKRLFL